MDTREKPFASVEEIHSKRMRGESLTAWEHSVHRLNFRDDGTRYSNDPKTRATQYEEDNASTQAARKGKRG